MVPLGHTYILWVISMNCRGAVTMKKIITVLIVLVLGMVPLTAQAGEGPLPLPKGANADANMHNEAGITSWNNGDAEGALGHFKEASAIDSSLGETHFNEAISLDKIGEHREATMHFKAALKRAGGNKKILGSPILHGHIDR